MLANSVGTRNVLQLEEDDQEEAGRRKRIAKLFLEVKSLTD